MRFSRPFDRHAGLRQLNVALKVPRQSPFALGCIDLLQLPHRRDSEGVRLPQQQEQHSKAIAS
jgi:hypothetical protein